MTRSKSSFIRKVVYIILAAAIVWQGVWMVVVFRRPPSMKHLTKIDVTISGNVNNPGTYRVPLGTTPFEILKVAGVRTTSDLAGIVLGNQLESNQSIAVGTRDKSVAVNAFVRLEFFLGSLSITTPDGQDRPVQEGMGIDAGNRLRTPENTQAELSINSYSRLDMDKTTEVSFDKIAVEDGKRIVDVFQRTGMCWYKVVYAGRDEQIRILTPLAQFTVSGKGADFKVEVLPTQVVIETREGLVVAERPKAGETVNLVVGQKAVAYVDGRPFDVTRIAPDATLTTRFAELNKKKVEVLVKYMPVNILMCAFPSVFHLVSIQFDRNEIHTVYIPSQTYVGNYVQGFSTMGEAFLYGGSAFVTTIVERILNVRVPKYTIIEKEDIARAVASLGGVSVTVDEAAAGVLGMRGGKQKLKDDEVVAFMRPGVTSSEEAVQRQMQVIKAVFEGFRSKSIVMTAMMADQLLSNIESNLTSAEILGYYTNFSSRPNWAFKSHNLPVENMTKGGRVYKEPILDACKKLLTEGQ